MISKLYSYYLSNLFRKNWIRLTLFTLLALVGTWFVAPFAAYYFLGKTKTIEWINIRTGEKVGFRELNKNFLGGDEVKIGLGQTLETVWATRQAWDTARQGGDKTAIEAAEQHVLDASKIEAFANSLASPIVPIQEVGYNILSLGVETENPGYGVFMIINKLSFWAIATGVSFSYLTLHLVDFLFLSPKKNGEDATVLTFTPGVKRSDLLISKILAFLTYYILFGLVTFVLPGFFYYLWAGSLAPLNLVWLWLYTLLAAPLIAFGLVILPYIILSNWSSLVGSLFSYAVLSIPSAFFFFALNSPWALKIRDWFFNPFFFIPLALGVGIVCLTLYYHQCQKEDLKD